MVVFLVCDLLAVLLADCGPAGCPSHADNQNQHIVEAWMTLHRRSSKHNRLDRPRFMRIDNRHSIGLASTLCRLFSWSGSLNMTLVAFSSDGSADRVGVRVDDDHDVIAAEPDRPQLRSMQMENRK
jgi:hypothetical protein